VNRDFIEADLYCYRRANHGYMPRSLIPRAHVRGQWAICPRCAMGADPDPRCLREIHYALIVEDHLPTKLGTGVWAPRKYILDKGWGAPATRRRAGTFTLEDARRRDGLLHAADAEARRRGYRDRDQLYSELADVEAIKRRYESRIRDGG
jgi:hypothetical protein